MTGFTELHDDLRAVARDLLGKTAVPEWQVQADAGWVGLEIAEDLGGSGATFAEAAIVLEERGRAATTGPWLGTAVLGVGVLNMLESGPERDQLLRAIAEGSRRVAVVLPAGDDPAIPFRVEGGRLRGQCEFVADAPNVDEVLVVALDGGEPVVVCCRPEVTAQPVLDATRSFGIVTADGIAVDAVWRFAEPRAVERLRERAAAAVSADSLGSAQAMLDATVAYAKVRQQFGRPIGSFQAVKHACADMLVQVTVGRELLSAAVAAVASHSSGPAASPEPSPLAPGRAPPTAVPGGSGGDMPGGAVEGQRSAASDPAAAVARATGYVTSSAVEVVGKAMQLHGGIGYTWESGVHVHLKRIALNRSLFGGPAEHRRRLAEDIRARYSSERSLS
jgi:alkylation response protein AidB-like acyl-CoA dehydrogenase